MRDFNAANIVVNKSYECRCRKENHQTNTHANCRIKGLRFKRRPIKLCTKLSRATVPPLAAWIAAWAVLDMLSFNRDISSFSFLIVSGLVLLLIRSKNPLYEVKSVISFLDARVLIIPSLPLRSTPVVAADINLTQNTG